ncbi:hypothetical protein E2562_010496 [Oryza meyeriana var. granulata]|uniref:Uncharacterized protein n=1 Tax=Oryza meyeriana var. granulata TaxID=110450 RepID=A0A6G1F6T4_9ORYZ|nr:hypothetical protein E2562_010496 [Oryza meyeriana var. granulata]
MLRPGKPPAAACGLPPTSFPITSHTAAALGSRRVGSRQRLLWLATVLSGRRLQIWLTATSEQ